MQDYIIITDSTTDLNIEMINPLNIEVLPLSFSIKGITYKDFADGRDIKIEEFYTKIREGEVSTTSQINPEDFIKAFKPHLEEGKDILYIAFSSGLSGTYSSAVIAKKELEGEFTERKIIVIDSLCASLGEGLLVYLAAKEKQKGKTIEELGEWLENKKKNLCHWFMVDDLKHLKRGGRLSATAAFFGSVLGIKPILHVNGLGKLALVEKKRGRLKAVNYILDKMEKTGQALEDQEIFISHGDCKDKALNMADLIKSKFKVKNIFINTIGPVIGTHAGPGTLAVFFLGKER